MRHTTRLLALLLPALAPAASAGEITSITNPAGLNAVPGLSRLEFRETYTVTFGQSALDPPISGLHIPFPAGAPTPSVGMIGGSGDVQVDLSALPGWVVDNAGHYLNLYDPAGTVTSGSVDIKINFVPADMEMGYVNASFSDNNMSMPGANLIPPTPGDSIRVPALVPIVGHNLLQLDNGGDFLAFINTPSVGSDPAMGDFSGDLYTKVIPHNVLTHAKGSMTLNCIKYNVFDQDWDQDDATLWAWMLTEGVDSSDTLGGGSGANPGNIEPFFADPGAVIVPEIPMVGLGNPLGFGVCPSPKEIAGWSVYETFHDTSTGLQIPIKALTADGATDYAFTHFAAGGQNYFSGNTTCPGSAGNMTLSWMVSDDFFGLGTEGENQTDWLGTGYSAFDSYRPAGGAFIPSNPASTSEVRFYFDEPTLNMRVDAGLDGGFDELGLAGLNLPIGMDSGGALTGTQAQLGIRVYSGDAAPATPGFNFLRLGLALLTFGPPLPAPGIPVNGSCLMLNPGDTLFGQSFVAFGIVPFEGVDTGTDGFVDETYYTSNQIPLMPALALLDVTMSIQGFDLKAIQETAVGTQVIRFSLRPND